MTIKIFETLINIKIECNKHKMEITSSFTLL